MIHSLISELHLYFKILKALQDLKQPFFICPFEAFKRHLQSKGTIQTPFLESQENSSEIKNIKISVLSIFCLLSRDWDQAKAKLSDASDRQSFT